MPPTSKSRRRPGSNASPRSLFARLGIPKSTRAPGGISRRRCRSNTSTVSRARPNAKLVLVTADDADTAGEGKTTTTWGLGDALNHIAKKAMICLREPSLGPVFGHERRRRAGLRSGGAMEDIICTHRRLQRHRLAKGILLAAMLDNHIHHGNDSHRRAAHRVGGRGDMNDRALPTSRWPWAARQRYPRQADSTSWGLRGHGHLLPVHLARRPQGSASADRGRLHARPEAGARPLPGHGAMTVLLKDAIKPNLVQTLENNPPSSTAALRQHRPGLQLP